MIKDSKHVSNASSIEADVCIVGGGTSGISMALQFINKPVKVCLLEGGGMNPDDRTKKLAAGQNLGTPYYSLDNARPRYFGGGSNLWAGWCRPLDPIDFEKRDWVPNSGWPISWDDLLPYYDRARELCEISGKSFDATRWASSASELYKNPFVNEDIPATVWVGSPPTKFGKRYKSHFEHAQNIDVYLNANVTELQTNELGNAVEQVKVATLNGNRFTVKAKIFVLLAGAIETARLLLASKQGNLTGIGNENDVVGRFFMEHPHVVTGRLHLFPRKKDSRKIIPALDYRLIKGAKARLQLERPVNGVKFAYTIDEKIQREHQLLNYSAHLRTISPTRSEETLKSIKLIVSNMRSMKTLITQVRKGTLPDGLGRHIKNLLLNPDDVFRVFYNQVLSIPTTLELYTQSEQVPNRNSRVMIDEEKDELGVPRAKLDWRFSLVDKVSIRKSQELLGQQFEKTGIGKLEPEPWVLDDDADHWSPSMIGGYHHLGTTRMGNNPKESVVDKNCLVHSMKNLYISSTSVFPTGGYANPLLTGVALTLRTADHIQGILNEKVHVSKTNVVHQ